MLDTSKEALRPAIYPWEKVSLGLELLQAMKVTDIYNHYQIPPNLQRHMLQVTAVGEYILNHWTGPKVNRPKVLTALLFHDMGNIVKFKQPFLGEIGETPEIAAHWLAIQQAFQKTYGLKSHEATEAIVRELGLDAEVQELIAVTSYGIIEVANYQSWESRIADHADMCVSPEGIVGFTTRMEDLRHRYNVIVDGRGIQLRVENAREVEQHVAGGLQDLASIDFSARIAHWAAFDVPVSLSARSNNEDE